ncbi:MAG: 30S ribosomal protein S18 [Candidatus Omnitrophica bacterium]|nr:30S ribosomal protein S18 [Candidatus Omnitrophota bacterium]
MRINSRNSRTRKPRKRSGMFMQQRKKVCRFCADKVKEIDYKDLKTLESFVKERGRIVSARSSGNCAGHQRQLTAAIKKARFLALVPYVRI